MRELHPQPRVLINPATAERYGIQDGQWVWIENDHGRFKQQAKVSPVVNEKTVHAEHGWWFPESDPSAPYLLSLIHIWARRWPRPGHRRRACPPVRRSSR